MPEHGLQRKNTKKCSALPVAECIVSSFQKIKEFEGKDIRDDEMSEDIQDEDSANDDDDQDSSISFDADEDSTAR